MDYYKGDFRKRFVQSFVVEVTLKKYSDNVEYDVVFDARVEATSASEAMKLVRKDFKFAHLRVVL